MKQFLKNHFKKITPIFFFTFIGILFCAGEIVRLIISKDNGELALGLLAIFIQLLLLLLIIDRFFVRKFSFLKIFIFELVLIIGIPIFYLNFNDKTKIFVTTPKPYFVLLYDKKGLTKENFPKRDFFNHSIIFENVSTLNLHYSISKDREIEVHEPTIWGGFCRKHLDTVLNNSPMKIEMYFHNVDETLRDSLFKKAVKNILFRNSTKY